MADSAHAGQRSLTPTPRNKNRSPNWKTAEDEQLVKAWLDVAQDPAIGNEQTSTVFWQRVHECYVKELGATDRAESAFQNRWRIIQRNVSKFCGAFAAVESRNESGKTSDDKVRDACTLYEAQNKTPFAMLTLWLLLRHAQKWMDMLSKPKSKQSVTDESTVRTEASGKDENLDTGRGESMRPMGKKRAKRELMNERGDLAESASQMAEESRRKRILSEKAFLLQEEELREKVSAREERIMSRDLSNLGEVAKTFYEKKQRQILRALEKEEEKEKELEEGGL